MDNKTPDNFWNDELVKEFVEGAIRVQDSMPHEVSLDLGILHFKKSKEHKVEEKRAEILDFRKMPDNKVELHSMYCFALRGFIPQEKYEAVKQAIERELNNDTVVEDKIVFDGERVNKYLIDEFGQTGKTEPLRFYSHKKYSQSEVDAIRKEAFCSGFFKGWYNGCFEEDKAYSNKIGEARYEEWLSSLTPTNNEPLSDSIPTLEINIPHAQKVIKEVLSTEKYGNVPTGFFTPQESKQDSKGWEVFSYQENDEAKTVWTIDKVQSNQWRNEFQNPDYWCNTSPTLTGTKFSLFQVRRLSDGEVFSVGDEEDFVGKITAIRIDAKYSGGIGLTGDCRTRAIETAIKLPLTEQPKPRQMWNKHTGIHDENECCKHLGCEYYNPINITHE